MSRSARRDAPSRHLIAKGSIGFLLGFPLSLWLSWLLTYGGLLPAYMPVRDQIAMWLATLLWCTAPCLAFLTRDWQRCLGIFAVANLAAFVGWKVLQ